MRIICYHYPCPDGAFAALAAHVAFQRTPSAEATPTRFQPLVVYEPPASRVAHTHTWDRDDEVYLLDFSGGTEFLLAAAARVSRVHLLDHHKTAQEEVDALAAAGRLPANVRVCVDMRRSGASIARDEFRTRELLLATDAERVLRLFDYIEDNDLWRHALPGSKEFSAGLGDLSLEYDINKNPGLWDTLLGLSADRLQARGQDALARQARIIEDECARAFIVTLASAAEAGPAESAPKCLAVITTFSELRSQMGNELATRSAARGLAPAGMVVYVEEGMGAAAASSYKVSVRSLSAFDTTAFTRTHGGGGHRNASSCVVPRATFETWRLAPDAEL